MAEYIDNLDNLKEELLDVIPISYLSSSIFEERIQKSPYRMQWSLQLGIGYIITEAFEGKKAAIEAKIKNMCNLFMQGGAPSIYKFVSFLIINYCEDNHTQVNLQKIRDILRSIGVVKMEELEQYDSNLPYNKDIVTEDKTCEYDKKYRTIIHHINKLCKGYEQDENIYKRKQEKELRALIVSALQPVFPELSSTSETINRKGKTDIIIKTSDNINILVAECKIWKGQVEFSKAIDQLLNYVTFRDTRTALILFVKNRKIRDVIKKAKLTIAKHPCCVKDTCHACDSSFSYIFHTIDDPQSLIALELMLFHYPE